MRCTIVTEGFGDMVFELYPKLAPITVKNFVDTARSGFYDGLAWCRIVKGYVIQGGSPDNDIMTDSDWHIRGEFEENGMHMIRQGRSSLLYIRMRQRWTADMRHLDRWFPVLRCWMRLQMCRRPDRIHGTGRLRCR